MTLGKLFNISETELPPTDHIDNVQLAGLLWQSNEKTCKTFQESDWFKKCNLLLLPTHVIMLCPPLKVPTSWGAFLMWVPGGSSHDAQWVHPPTHLWPAQGVCLATLSLPAPLAQGALNFHWDKSIQLGSISA